MSMLRRHALLIVAVTLVAGVVTGALAVTRPPLYRSRADLLVATGFLTGSYGPLVKPPYQTQSQLLVTQAKLASEQDVAALASTLLGGHPTASEVEARIAIAASQDVNVITVTATGGSRASAEALARAYARAVAARARAQSRHEILTAIAAVGRQLAGRPSRAAATALRAQLAKLQVYADGTDGGVQVTQAATTATDANVSTPPLVALGLVIGLALGLAAAAARDRLEHRLDDEQVATLLHARILGRMPAAASAYSSATAPTGAEAEAARRLALAVDNVAMTSSARTLVVTAAHAHESRTRIAAVLAVAMAETGRRVILIEADTGAAGLQQGLFGLEPGGGLTDALTGSVHRVDELLHTVSLRTAPHGTLRVLCAGPAPDGPAAAILSGSEPAELLAALESEADYLLIDAPPALDVPDPLLWARHADALVLVVPDPGSRAEELERLYATVETGSCRVLGAVVAEPARRGSARAGEAAAAQAAAARV
jgi:Mrp family chromosome partitioning ATPase